MYTPNRQYIEITQIASEPLYVTPTFQKPLEKMMPRMTYMKNIMLKMQANVRNS